MNNNNNNTNKKCDNEPEVLNGEDPLILFLEDNVKGFKIGLMLLSLIIVTIILIYIFNPVVLENDTSSSANALKSKIGYITISTIVFFICLTLLGKMFINVKNNNNGNNNSSSNESKI